MKDTSSDWKFLGEGWCSRDKLPLAVPRYVQVIPEYAAYRYLRGRAVDPGAADADTLGTFLRALHGLDPDPELRELLPCEDRRAVAKEFEMYLSRPENFLYLLADFGQAFVDDVARSYGHPDLERLRRNCRYFAIVDQIGTIVDGPGVALAGQEDAAWRRLQRFLQDD